MLSIPELQHSHHTVCSLQLNRCRGRSLGSTAAPPQSRQPCLEHSVYCPAEVEGVAFKRFDAGPVKLSEGARTVSAQHRAVVQDQAHCISLLTACCVHRPLAGRTGVRTSIPLRLFPATLCSLPQCAKQGGTQTKGLAYRPAVTPFGLTLCHCCHVVLLQPGNLGAEQQRPQSSAGQVRQ
jgi:hypothetical protein